MHVPPDLLANAVALGRVSCGRLLATVVSLGSLYSAASLLVALAVAVLVTVAARRRRGRKVRLRVVLRALFPGGLFSHPSVKADLGFFLLNVLVTGALIDWAVLSGDAVSRWTGGRLLHAIGPAPLHALPAWAAGAVTTTALFLAYELGYYADHWLAHHVSARWELHKPHHTAETLNPLTNARVHPLDSLVFANILAVVMGLTGGLCTALFGPGHEASLAGHNALFLVCWFALGHLQHSNVWMTLPGPLGWALLSPAHHQLHHSADPRDFGKNLGSFLSIYDRMFGTLRPPRHQREPLRFGVEGDPARHHSISGGLIDPVTGAVAALWRPVRRALDAGRRRPCRAGPGFRGGAGATTSAP